MLTKIPIKADKYRENQVPKVHIQVIWINVYFHWNKMIKFKNEYAT